MTIQLDILGEIEKLKGMNQALDHAEREKPGWKKAAYAELEIFCMSYPGRIFAAEEFRSYCSKRGVLSDPPSLRAFGGIMLKAARNGLISKVGYAPVSNPRAHRCFSTQWKVN